MIVILNYINIFYIWGDALCLVWIVSRMEYDFKECVLAFRNKKSECYQYLMDNKYYLVAIPLIFVLVLLSVGLLSQAYTGMVKIRSELTISMSILNFILTPCLFMLFFLKLYKKH